MASNNTRSISKRGRPKKLGPQVIQRIMSTYESSSYSLEEVIKHMGIEGVHVQTVRNCLTDEGYCKSINCQKMWLTNDSRQLRLRFATLYRNWNLEWRAVLFATTAHFDLGENHKAKIYNNKGTFLCADCQSKRHRATKLQFWLIVGLHQKAQLVLSSDKGQLETVFGKLIARNASAEEHATHQKRYLFMDETCSATYNHPEGSFFPQCAEKAGFKVVEYPSFCSDLNLAEDVLHYVKKQLQKTPFGSVEHMRTGIFEQWERISIRHINKLVGTFPSRFAEVIRREGRPL